MRTYKPKQPRYPRGRMLRAVRLRGQGLSLRQSAAVLGVHHDTVWRDLRRWDKEAAERAKVTRLSDRAVGKTPPGGGNQTAGSDSEATVTPLRRRA
jgi:hypothetical protein